MVICPDCGKEVPNAKFCRNCGAKLPEVEEIKVVETEAVVDSAQEATDADVVDVNIVDEEPVSDSDEEIEVNTSKNTKFCSNCGNEVSVETAFCPKCGYRLIQEEKPQTKFCQSCGKKIDINAEICPYCGVRVAGIRSSEEKSVVLSAILSFLFPGLGHLYIGLTKKGISFIVAYIISAFLIIFVIGFVLIFIVWIWALIDSIKSTEAINRGDYVEDKLF